jgi:hypothetical protein
MAETLAKRASDAPGAPGLPVIRDAVRRVLTRMFGPPPFDPDRDPGDPGLTGPDSPSWRVIGEPAAIAGGIRGLLTQVSHPLAMAGVYDHSAFREDPLGRLQRTSAYVTTSAFGSTAEAIAIAGRVRAVHPRVVGTAPDGRPYRADDPRLLVWVSIALTSSFLATHRLWSPDVLTPAEEDRFVAEQSRIGALLDPEVDLRMLRDPESARRSARGARRRARAHRPRPPADSASPSSTSCSRASSTSSASTTRAARRSRSCAGRRSPWSRAAATSRCCSARSARSPPSSATRSSSTGRRASHPRSGPRRDDAQGHAAHDGHLTVDACRPRTHEPAPHR